MAKAKNKSTPAGRPPIAHIIKKIYLQPTEYTKGVMEGIRYAVKRILGGEQGRGYQAARVEKKLDQLAAKGVKLEQHTVREVRRMLEAEFEKERIEVQKLGVLALETPSRQVMDPLIKKRLRK